MRELIGQAIRRACRRALWVRLGIRIPAARIRCSDLLSMRTVAHQRVLKATREAAYWKREVARLDAELLAATAAFHGLCVRRDGLVVPNPSRPMDSI